MPYIDDTLVLAKTEKIRKDHTSGVLEILGYIIKTDNHVTIHDFVGIKVDSNVVKLCRLAQKKEQCLEVARSVRDRFLWKR